MALYEEMKATNVLSRQFPRTLAILGAIRLKQNLPHECLEMLSAHDDFDVTIRYVRILAHLKLNEFEHVFRLIRLTTDPPEVRSTRSVPKIPDQMVIRFVLFTYDII